MQCLSGLDVRNQPPSSFTVLERSIDRARRDRGRKFKPVVLGEIQAAGDTSAGSLSTTLNGSLR
jgi:hypothetical protein